MGPRRQSSSSSSSTVHLIDKLQLNQFLYLICISLVILGESMRRGKDGCVEVVEDSMNLRQLGHKSIGSGTRHSCESMSILPRSPLVLNIPDAYGNPALYKGATMNDNPHEEC
jgi:hypothetical protein